MWSSPRTGTSLFGTIMVSLVSPTYLYQGQLKVSSETITYFVICCKNILYFVYEIFCCLVAIIISWKTLNTILKITFKHSSWLKNVNNYVVMIKLFDEHQNKTLEIVTLSLPKYCKQLNFPTHLRATIKALPLKSSVCSATTHLWCVILT